MSIDESRRFVLRGQNGVVLSYMQGRAEITRCYASQAIWIFATILLGLAVNSLLGDASRSDPLFAQRKLGLNITLGAAFAVEVLIGLSYLIVEASGRSRAVHLRLKCAPFSRDRNEDVWAVVDALCNDIGNVPPFIVVLDANDPSWAPSVSEDSRGAVLVLPLGFLKVFETHPNSARALLAHELGHICEHDSWLLATQRMHARMYRWCVVPSVVALLVCGVVTLSPVGVSTWAVIGAFRSSRRAKLHFDNARKASEDRADLYACVFSSGAALIEAFRRYATKQRTSHSHPFVAERIASITQADLDIDRYTQHAATHPEGAAVAVIDFNGVLASPPPPSLRHASKRKGRWRPGR